MGQTFTVIAVSGNNNRSFIWSSEDPSVAVVDNNGVIKGIKEGYITVKVSTIDGEKSELIDVIVSENSGSGSSLKMPLLIIGGILLLMFVIGIIYFLIKSKNNNDY